MKKFQSKFPIIDDIGGFPLPNFSQKEMFEDVYWDAYRAMVVDNIDVSQNRGVQTHVIRPIVESLKRKLQTGLDIVCYPQLQDMCQQFLKPIQDYELEENPYIIVKSNAKILEMELLKNYAKEQYENSGKKLKLKACVTGPLELYQKKIGFAVYKDIALNYAKNVNNFLKNSIINEKFAETIVVSIDEPSIGLVTFNQITDDDIIDILKVCTEGVNADIQIHLHSLNSYQLALNVEKINVLTCEYASNQKNVIPKKDLDEYDKFIRVGVSRTNIDAIISEEIEKGRNSREFEKEEAFIDIIDSTERIQKRYREAIIRYGDRLKYVGPDCGLSSWVSQDIATMYLSRTVEAINEIRI